LEEGNGDFVLNKIIRKARKGIKKFVKSKWYKHLPGLVLASLKIFLKRGPTRDDRPWHER
jgi:hypothetical protein